MAEFDLQEHRLERAKLALAKTFEMSLRSSLVGSGHATRDYDARVHFNEFLSFVRSSSEPVAIGELIDHLVRHFDANDYLSTDSGFEKSEQAAIRLAQAGLRYLLELSCEDRAASGRQSKALAHLEAQSRLFQHRFGA